MHCCYLGRVAPVCLRKCAGCGNAGSWFASHTDTIRTRSLEVSERSPRRVWPRHYPHNNEWQCVRPFRGGPCHVVAPARFNIPDLGRSRVPVQTSYSYLPPAIIYNLATIFSASTTRETDETILCDILKGNGFFHALSAMPLRGVTSRHKRLDVKNWVFYDFSTRKPNELRWSAPRPRTYIKMRAPN